MLDIAYAVAEHSKDPSTKVGCVIVDQDKRIVSTGYNGMIAGSMDEHLPFERPMKYRTVIHAEMNALLFARRDLKNCTMYITDAPCEQCLKHTLQAGIRKIYYGSTEILRRWNDTEGVEAIKRLILSVDATVLNWNTKDSLISELSCLYKEEDIMK